MANWPMAAVHSMPRRHRRPAFRDDRVLILDRGPADEVDPRVESLAKTQETVQRSAVVIQVRAFHRPYITCNPGEARPGHDIRVADASSAASPRSADMPSTMPPACAPAE